MIGWFASLSFVAPLALLALAALPAIWLLLRVTPPAPRHLVFPPLKLFAHLHARRETPARTPWWLTALRLLLAACVILAVAGPVWNPRTGDEAAGQASAPLALVIDSGAASAHDWATRIDLASRLVETAGRAGAPIAMFATGETPAPQSPETAAAILRRLGALAPQAFAPDRLAWRDHIRAWLRSQPGARVVWISDGVDLAGKPGAQAAAARQFASDLTDASGGQLIIYGDAPAAALALAGVVNGADGLEARIVRATAQGMAQGMARAFDMRGLPLGEGGFTLAAGAVETQARINLPIEMRNRAARIDIVGQQTAQAVTLLDRRNQRRRVGLVTGVTADMAQPLLSPTWYVDRALAPTAEIREPRMGASAAIGALIDEQASVIVLADVGGLEPAMRQRLEAWVRSGGVLVRFAGPRLAAAGGPDMGASGAADAGAYNPVDRLLPVRLRGDGRNLGGALSWETPKTLAPFNRDGPFAGIDAPEEITVRRQLLAEPDGDLPGRTWASLADGTPVVTARRDGEGLLVLFHVTADPSWSNLPMSGAFVQMLQRIVAMAPDSAPEQPAGQNASEDAEEVRDNARTPARTPARPAALPPRRMLDGFGLWRDPPATARGVTADFAGRASLAHPAGFYGPVAASRAVNVLEAGDVLTAIDFSGFDARPSSARTARDLRDPLLLLALGLFLADCLATLLLGGGLMPRRPARSAALTALAFTAGAWLVAPEPAHAQGMLNTPQYQLPDSWRAPGQAPAPTPRARQAAPKPPSPPRTAVSGFTARDLDAAMETRLAYVITGDAQVDAVSRAGLIGLGEALAQRTSFEPAEPAGVNPSTDELAFYPVLYWPVVAGRPAPDAAALRKLDSYMKGGGLVIFDTRDAMTARPGVTTPEGAQLQRMLRTLDLPALEPAPQDHVLGKAFYLLDNFPGRYSRGQTWVEALPKRANGERVPARGGDGVTPVIITSNDWAAAWAVDASGLPMLPLTTDGHDSEERQRELALRVGVNVVIHALTGNYKADQVHLPALLRRLGQ